MSSSAKPPVDSLKAHVTKVAQSKTDLQTKALNLANKLELMKEERLALQNEESKLRQKLAESSRQNASLKDDCGQLERELETEKVSHSSLVLTVDALQSKKIILQQELESRDREFQEERDLGQGCADLPEGFENPGKLLDRTHC